MARQETIKQEEESEVERLERELGIEIVEASNEKDAASKILEVLELSGEDILKNSLEENDV